MTQQVYIVEYGDLYSEPENNMFIDSKNVAFADYEDARQYLIGQGFVQDERDSINFSKYADKDEFYKDGDVKWHTGEHIQWGTIKRFPVMESNRILCETK